MSIFKSFIFMFVFMSLSASGYAGETRWKDSYALQAKGDFEQAAEILLQEQGNSTNEFALLRVAYLGYLQGNYNESIDFYQQALKLNNDSIDTHLGITLPLLAQQRWRQVKVHTAHVLQQSAWNYSAHVKLMIAEQGLAEWRQLARHAKALTSIYPSDPVIWVYLARASSWMGEADRALAAYKEVLKRSPNHIEALTYIKTNP